MEDPHNGSAGLVTGSVLNAFFCMWLFLELPEGKTERERKDVRSPNAFSDGWIWPFAEYEENDKSPTKIKQALTLVGNWIYISEQYS